MCYVFAHLLLWLVAVEWEWSLAPGALSVVSAGAGAAWLLAAL